EKLFNKWLALILDQIAGELLTLNNLPNSRNKTLHICLILFKLEKIAIVSDDIERITFLSKQALFLKNGGKLDINRLSDMKYSSQFETQLTTNQGKSNKNNHIHNQVYSPLPQIDNLNGE